MQEKMEKIYDFSRNEFLILLSMAGAKNIYSFPLPRKDTFERKAFLQSLYALSRGGFLRIEGKPELSAEMKRLIGHISAAALALTIIPAETMTQKICYLSAQNAVVVELCGKKDALRIEQLSAAECLQALFEGIGGEPVASQEEGLRMEHYYGRASAERQEILRQEGLMSSPNFLIWSKRERMKSAWDFFDMPQRRSVRRLLFLEGCMNTWVLEQTEKETQLYYDSLQFRGEIRKLIAESMQKAAKGRNAH